MKSLRILGLLCVLTLIAAPLAWASVTESFDTFTNAAYGTYIGPPQLGVGWKVVNGLGEATSFSHSGAHAVRLRNNASPDLTNEPYLEYIGTDGNGKDGGVGVFSFWYRSYSANPTVQRVSVSINGGAYDSIGGISTNSTTYAQFNYTMNNSSDNIKIRVQRVSGVQFVIDDYFIADYGGVDLTPPSITSVTPIGATQLDVLWSEPVDLTTSQVLTNYVVNNGVGNPTAAVRDGGNPAIVHLTYNPIPVNSYVLTVNGVQDLAGNSCVDATGNFSIADATPPSISTITVINSTRIDVVFSEYVERTSSQTLTYYVVNNAVGNPTVATRDGTDSTIVHLTFPAMANNNYILTVNGVRDLAGNTALGATGNFSINDVTPPTIVSITAQNDLFVDVLFSESLDAATATVAANYVATPGSIIPTTATLDGSNLALVHLVFPSLANNTYTLTVNGVKDLAQNPCVDATADFTVNVTVPWGTILINEIMYDDSASGTDSEWVELYNPGLSAVDLSGWIITDSPTYPGSASGGVLQIPASTIMAAGAHQVFARSAMPGISNVVICPTTWGTFALGNTGDHIALFTDDSTGTLVDGSLNLNYPAIATRGNSIEKCVENSSWTSASSAWHMSTILFLPSGRFIYCTPNAVNSECIIDNIRPTLVSATVVTNTVVDVTFSEFVDATTATVVTNYSVNLGVGNPTSAVQQSNHAVVRLTFGSAMAANTYTLTVNNVQDLAGNPILPGSTTPFTVLPPAPPMIFTEIMPNPNFFGTADSLGEWFEIYNPGTSTINMNGWIVGDNAGSDTIEGTTNIAAGQYFVFCSNGDISTNGGVPVNYAYHYGTSGWGLSLNNSSADSLWLRAPGAGVSATMHYTAAFPFSEGRSAQLKDLARDVNVDTNWCRTDTVWVGATNNDRGTPGHASICAPNLPAAFYSICDLRAEDACGIPVHDQQHVITQGIVTWVDSCRRNAYIELNQCGMEIYGQTVRDTMIGATRKMQPGDFVEVNGWMKHYYGLTELDSLNTSTPRPIVTFLSAGNPVPAPATVTAAQVSMTVSNCSAEPYESRIVRLLGVGFPMTADSVFHHGVEYHAGLGPDSIKLYWQNCDTIMDPGTRIPVGLVNLTGVLSQHTTNPSCKCDGYELVTAGDPFTPAECITPLSATVYRVGAPADSMVEVRWQPGLNQTCDCYKVYASDTQDFATSTIAGCVCGDTKLRIRLADGGAKRFFRVTASAGCD